MPRMFHVFNVYNKVVNTIDNCVEIKLLNRENKLLKL